MPLVPPAFPLSFLVGLLSVALVGGGAYALWGWYTGALATTAFLVGGLAALLCAVAGRGLALLLLGRGETDGPTEARTGELYPLTRPDGTTLRVERYGLATGPTVILTHGWGMNSTEWFYARRALAAHYRVFVWDLRGLGESTQSPSGDYRVETMAADLEAVLGLAAGEDVVLVGHSIGGMTTLAFCRQFNEHLAPTGRVAGVALVNSTYTTPLATTTASGFFTAIRRPVLEPLLHLTVWLWPVMWLGSWLSFFNGSAHLLAWLTGFAGRAPRQQLDFAARLGVKASPAVLARGILATFRFDESATLATVGVPALVVTGEGDRVLVPEASAHMAEAMPAARLFALPDARHQALLQRHRDLDAALLEFAGACFLPATTAQRAA